MPFPSVEVKTQIFLTDRAEPLPRWREAFPTASFLTLTTSGTALARNASNAIVWLHIQADIMNPSESIHALKSRWPNVPVVALSNTPTTEEGLAALSAGASGYCSALALPDALRQVASVVEQGGLWVGTDLMRRLFNAMASRTQPTAASLDALSPRERQTALAVARGSTNKEIARAMGITERTVKAHVSAILEKLDVRDRLQLSLLVNGVEPPAPEAKKISA